MGSAAWKQGEGRAGEGRGGGCAACSPILAYSCISVSFFIISSILIRGARVTPCVAELAWASNSSIHQFINSPKLEGIARRNRVQPHCFIGDDY